MSRPLLLSGLGQASKFYTWWSGTFTYRAFQGGLLMRVSFIWWFLSTHLFVWKSFESCKGNSCLWAISPAAFQDGDAPLVGDENTLPATWQHQSLEFECSHSEVLKLRDKLHNGLSNYSLPTCVIIYVHVRAGMFYIRFQDAYQTAKISGNRRGTSRTSIYCPFCSTGWGSCWLKWDACSCGSCSNPWGVCLPCMWVCVARVAIEYMGTFYIFEYGQWDPNLMSDFKFYY